MRRHRRSALATVLALASVVALSACGSSSSSSTSTGAAATTTSGSATAAAGGPVKVVVGTAPDSLDPQFGYTTQAAEADWLAYTGLTTYAHANGQAGGTVIPGLATALPVVSDGGKTYTATLRKGLVYSNGKPVKASDFAYTIERALKLPWGGSGQFYGGTIKGAAEFAAGKAKSISGIVADDATGTITIHLIAPYGAFDNVLAFPSSGLVPSGTPMKNMPLTPPPGVGPYMITNVVANSSFQVVKNPHWTPIPGIPSGYNNISVSINPNVSSNALAVLQNSADVFDYADTVPGSLLPQIKAQASDRYSKKIMNSTYYVFLNTQTKPFSSQLAREAVITGIDQNAMSRLGSGTLIPGCYFLPPGMVGHPTQPCPYGDPASGGNLAKAKQLVQQSGMAGQPVTVWSQTRSPRQQWMTYYTQFLNQIGFKATQKVIADATYWTTIGNLKLNPQTGFADWNQDFPNPIDFYLLLQSTAIQPNNNQNFGQVKDAHVDSTSKRLGATPSSRLQSIAAQWQALDTYVAQKAYVGAYGYQTFPAFTSNRIDLSKAIFGPQYGWDWSSLTFK
ncbi:MAG TPA: ABC transporter substrate-binding protein [Solirubrobacteraceae bacterium]|nr:ABC transporter substrate-binding protein [Solirubrobacteraceae bacterium]